MQILFLISLSLLITQQSQIYVAPVKRYAIKHNALSSIQIPITNVFHMEMQIPEPPRNQSEEQSQLKMADFCLVKDPKIMIEFKQSQQVFNGKYKNIVFEEKIYSLSDLGYLKFYWINNDFLVDAIGETMVEYGNFSNVEMHFNMVDTLMLREDNKLQILIYNGQEFIKNELEIATEDGSIQFVKNKLFHSHNGLIDMYELGEKLVLIDTLETMINSQIYSYKWKYLIGQNVSHLILYEYDSYEMMLIEEYEIEGLKVDVINGYIVGTQQFGKGTTYLLELQVIKNKFVLRQNVTITDKQNQVFTTDKVYKFKQMQYIFVLQNNLVSIMYFNFGQNMSKNILENAQEIFYYRNDSFLSLDNGEISVYQIYQEQAQLTCMPSRNYSTGSYELNLQIDYFVNDQPMKLDWDVELYVYTEIFKNGNQGLYAGLGIGLGLSLVVIIIFIWNYVKLRANYHLIDNQMRLQELSFIM